MSESRLVLVTFAVAEEAAGFDPGTRSHVRAQALLTGMGSENADRAVAGALRQTKPSLVVSCGFAGGLNPDWKRGQVVYTAAGAHGFESALLVAGARSGKFHTADRVATTATEKRELRETTGADVVEMESGCIAAICRSEGVPCAIARVILDEQQEDLPLDFNRLMNERRELNYARLAWELAKAPGKLQGLMRLRQQSREAALALGGVLNAAFAAWRET